MEKFAKVLLLPIAISISLALSAAMTSCARSSQIVSCRKILEAMTLSEIGLPSGKIYDSSAEDGYDEYLSDSLISALLGNGKLPKVTEAWIDCAFFIALNEHPCEFAVILCKDSDTAIDTARLLSAHLNEVKLLKGSGEYSEYTENAKVTVVKNFALLIISSDADNALKTAKKYI